MSPLKAILRRLAVWLVRYHPATSTPLAGQAVRYDSLGEFYINEKTGKRVYVESPVVAQLRELNGNLRRIAEAGYEERRIAREWRWLTENFDVGAEAVTVHGPCCQCKAKRGAGNAGRAAR